MKHSIKLGFIGTYKVDLIHYFSRILVAMNQSVAIVDATNEQYLLPTIPDPINNKIHYNGVDCYVNQIQINQLILLDYSEYDITLIDYGMNEAVADDYFNCALIFVVTDFERHHITKLKNLISNTFIPTLKVVKVYRDFVNSKITRKYIDFLLELEVKAKVLAEYVFELNEEDYTCKLLSQYNDIISFKKLRKGYKQMFSDVIEELYQINHREAIKYIKVAEEGKQCKYPFGATNMVKLAQQQIL